MVGEAAGKTSAPAPKTYSVTQVNYFLQKYIEREPFFKNFWVKAEVSGVKYHSSGHVYLELKDDKSRVRAVIFRYIARKLQFKLKDGMEVVCQCSLDIYIEGGSYSLKIVDIQELGEGELYRKFLELKEKLKEEGIFDPEHKKEIPPFCRRIGVVTSRSGAVIRDILRVIKRRAPWVEVWLFPATVQGLDAGPDIVRAFQLAVETEGIDAIIVGRGGGSMEDLWCFNYEPLAREIFAAGIPVVSAVGHEIDWTIVDFVADRRAATPTEAAEICTPDRAQLQKKIRENIERCRNVIENRVIHAWRDLSDISQRRYFQDPRRIIGDKSQRTAELAARLAGQTLSLLASKRRGLDYSLKLLSSHNPIKEVNQRKEKLCSLRSPLLQAMKIVLDNKRSETEKMRQAVYMLGPRQVLERGYTFVERAGDGTLLKNASQLTAGDQVKIHFADGTALSEIRSTTVNSDLEGEDNG